MLWILPPSSSHICSWSRTTESPCSAALCHCHFIAKLEWLDLARWGTQVNSPLLKCESYSRICAVSCCADGQPSWRRGRWKASSLGFKDNAVSWRKLCKCHKLFFQAYRRGVNAEIHLTKSPTVIFGLQSDRCTIYLTSIPPPWNLRLFYWTGNSIHLVPTVC